jgi:hypothetical protein
VDALDSLITFEIKIAVETSVSTGWSDQFEVNVLAAFVAQREFGSASDGDQVRKTMLIMHDAIKTIDGSQFSRLKNLRHNGAHSSANICLH